MHYYRHFEEDKAEIEIDAQDSNHKNFLRFVANSNLRIPDYGDIRINKVGYKNKDVKKIIKNWFPSVEQISINYLGPEMIMSKEYLEDISRVWHKVSVWIRLGNMIFTTKDFQKYLVSLKNTARVEFNNSLLEVNHPLQLKNSLKRSKIEEIKFNSRLNVADDWNKTKTLDFIISGISEEPTIQNCLRCFGVYGYNITRSDIIVALTKYKLQMHNTHNIIW